MSKKFLAKSSGVTIQDHSTIIEKTALLLLWEISKDYDTYNRFKHAVKYSALLHDIGKLTTKFQKFMYGKLRKPSLKYRHNENGWAFLSAHLADNFPNRDIILNITYWHHGTSNAPCKHTDTKILSELSPECLSNMLSYLTEVVGEDNIKTYDEFTHNSVYTPRFYDSTNTVSHNLNFCRSITITADRLASDMEILDESLIAEKVTNYFKGNDNVSIVKTKFDGSKRFEEQKQIVESSLIDDTTILKAPAGYGKTIMAVMWAIKQREKALMVVPRNTIARSLYISVLEELKNLNIDISVQLILTGEIKKTNRPDLGLYECDIVITNIDNFLVPDFKNDRMDSSSLILRSNVIFDEYHELVTDARLFSLFISIMKIRHNLCKTKTLLLSATPIEIQHLWDTNVNNNNTLILPSPEKHYSAVHNKKYLLKTTDKTHKIEGNTRSLFIKNTIPSAQKEKRRGEYDLLLHGQFTEERKISDLNKLITNYGKYSDKSTNKPNIIGTHILQASLDVSFNHLYEHVLSNQTTLQRIGRCDRWGDLDGQSTITIIKEAPNSTNKKEIQGDNKIKEVLYSRNLSDAWFDFISEKNGEELSLDELYVLYNQFTKKYSAAIKKYVKDTYDTSLKNLDAVYPIKYDDKQKKSDIIIAGSNKLRSGNAIEIFYIVKHKDTGEWVGVFSKKIFGSFGDEFEECSNIANRQIKTMKKLIHANDTRFMYNDIIDNKRINIDGIRDKAKFSNSPYIVYNLVYDEELGIVKAD